MYANGIELIHLILSIIWIMFSFWDSFILGQNNGAHKCTRPCVSGRSGNLRRGGLAAVLPALQACRGSCEVCALPEGWLRCVDTQGRRDLAVLSRETRTLSAGLIGRHFTCPFSSASAGGSPTSAHHFLTRKQRRRGSVGRGVKERFQWLCFVSSERLLILGSLVSLPAMD